eukprot:4935445-Amphidinium_carterae.1
MQSHKRRGSGGHGQTAADPERVCSSSEFLRVDIVAAADAVLRELEYPVNATNRILAPSAKVRVQE